MEAEGFPTDRGVAMDTVYHICEEKQLGTVYDIAEHRYFSWVVHRKNNEFFACWLADRHARQIQYECIDKYAYVAEGYWLPYRLMLSRREIRNRHYLQKEGRYVVVSNLGDKDLPEDHNELVGLLKGWLMNMPPNRQYGGNNDFGGPFKGSRSDHTDPERYIILGHPEYYVKHILEQDGRRYTEDSYGNIILHTTVEDGEKYTRERFLSVTP